MFSLKNGQCLKQVSGLTDFGFVANKCTLTQWKLLSKYITILYDYFLHICRIYAQAELGFILIKVRLHYKVKLVVLV